MAEKRKKRKRKSKPAGPVSAGGGGPPSSGGVMQSIRSGFRRAAGAEQASTQPSRLSNIVWTIVLLGTVAFLLYHWYG
jgi:hypothetical protein